MSEAKEAPEKKKGGKLPIIIALVMMLLTGGFFGLKMRGGGEKKKEEIKLGEFVEMKEEYLVNINRRRNFLRFTIAFRLKEGYKPEVIEKMMPALQAKLTTVCEKRTLEELSNEAGKDKLCIDVAYELNKILTAEDATHAEKKEHATEEEGEKDKEKKEGDEHSEAPKKSEGAPKPKHADWSSDTGPILQVFFRTFATQ